MLISAEELEARLQFALQATATSWAEAQEAGDEPAQPYFSLLNLTNVAKVNGSESGRAPFRHSEAHPIAEALVFTNGALIATGDTDMDGRPVFEIEGLQGKNARVVVEDTHPVLAQIRQPDGSYAQEQRAARVVFAEGTSNIFGIIPDDKPIAPDPSLFGVAPAVQQQNDADDDASTQAGPPTATGVKITSSISRVCNLLADGRLVLRRPFIDALGLGEADTLTATFEAASGCLLIEPGTTGTPGQDLVVTTQSRIFIHRTYVALMGTGFTDVTATFDPSDGFVTVSPN